MNISHLTVVMNSPVNHKYALYAQTSG